MGQGLTSLNIQDNYKTQVQERMRNFEENQRRFASNYNSTVANRREEKESSELIRQMRDQQYAEQRANQLEQQKLIDKQNLKSMNHQQLQMQLQQRQSMQGLSEKEYLAMEVQRKAEEARKMMDEETIRKVQQKQAYKEMLD